MTESSGGLDLTYKMTFNNLVDSVTGVNITVGIPFWQDLPTSGLKAYEDNPVKYATMLEY